MMTTKRIPGLPKVLMLAFLFLTLNSCNKSNAEGRTIKIYGLSEFEGYYGSVKIYDGNTLIGGNDVLDEQENGSYYKDIHKIEGGKLVLGLYDEYPGKNWTKRGTYQLRFTINTNVYDSPVKSYQSDNVNFKKASVTIYLSDLDEVF